VNYRGTTLWLGTALLLAPASVVAQSDPPGAAPESQEQPAEREAGAPPSEAELLALADELGVTGSAEAVLLVYSRGALEVLRVGARLVAPEPPESGRGARQLVRDLSEGIVAVELAAGGRSWEGQVQVYKGAVNLLDVDTVLLTSGSAETELQQAAAAFDLFGFYDELDLSTGIEARLAYCTQVLGGTLTGPDRTLVAQVCGRLERKNDEALRREEELARLVGQPDELVEALLEPEIDDESEHPRQLLLYQPDGTLRARPRGTIARGIAGISTVTAAAASIAGAFYWEYRAQQEYLLFRKAEQFGEDTQMTEHLFYTQQHDRRRDAAIGVGTAAITAAVVMMVIEKVEAERFRKARAALVGSAAATRGAQQ
jgi:hypothetical protein